MTKSPLGLFKEISPKRNFFQGEPPAKVRPLCAFGANSPTPALSGRTKSFALCGARVGAPPRHPASLREGLTQALFLVVRIKILCQHNVGRAKLHSDHRNASFAAMPAASALGGMSTNLVVAHSPTPSAWAHLIRRLSATPSPRGEGFGTDLNSMST